MPALSQIHEARERVLSFANTRGVYPRREAAGRTRVARGHPAQTSVPGARAVPARAEDLLGASHVRALHARATHHGFHDIPRARAEVRALHLHLPLRPHLGPQRGTTARAHLGSVPPPAAVEGARAHPSHSSERSREQARGRRTGGQQPQASGGAGQWESSGGNYCMGMGAWAPSPSRAPPPRRRQGLLCPGRARRGSSWSGARLGNVETAQQSEQKHLVEFGSRAHHRGRRAVNESNVGMSARGA